MRVLLFSDDSHRQTGRSGYSVLSDYVLCDRKQKSERAKSNSILKKITLKLIRVFSTSKWIDLNSVKLELDTWLNFRPSLVHYLWGERDIGFFYLFKNFIKTKVVATFHDCPDNISHILDPKKIKKIDRIILVSNSQKAVFLSMGVAESKIDVIHHGVDTAWFVPDDNEKAEAFTIMSVGLYRRNIPLLLEVCELYSAKSNARFLLRVDQKWANSFNQLKNVTLLPFLSDVELKKTYQKASCMLLTFENATANNALLEAISCGLPIVSESVGGIPEYLNHQCSILCEKGNVKQLIEALSCLENDLKKRKTMAQAARSRALELDWNIVARKVEESYLKII